ncbi:MAG: (d)CMP kinase [bacterium]
MKHMNIAIDGPSGAGKSTLARKAAEKLGYLYVDTGALYRTLGLFILRRGVSSSDAAGIRALLPEAQVGMVYRDGLQRMLLNGEDVTDLIRTPEVTKYASEVSAYAFVRDFLMETQRRLAREHSVIMDGRDIGTVVLPQADVKIFLTASAEARARRRYLEFQEKGVETTYDEVLADIRARDEHDSTRPVAPLKPAPDSVLLDTTELNAEESLAALVALIQHG